MFKFLFLMLFALISFPSQAFSDNDDSLYYIWSETCPICEQSNEFLSQYDDPAVDIIALSVQEDRAEIQHVLDETGVDANAVPLFIYKNDHFVGMNKANQQELDSILTPDDEQDESDDSFSLFGFSIEESSLLLSTLLIGAVDGFNPCSIWALMFLLSMIIRFQSRRKIAMIGFFYIITVSMIYGLFIFGTFSIITNIIDNFLIRFLFFSLASAIAFINIREGIGKEPLPVSFSISSENKKGFIQKIREYFSTKNSTPTLIFFAIMLGVFASLIELPCTAGFPVIWNSLISLSDVNLQTYFVYLIVYLLMYMSIEFIILFIALYTMKKSFISNQSGQTLKFLSGTTMLFLGSLLLLGYDYMSNGWIIFLGLISTLAASWAYLKMTQSKK